MKTWTRGQSDGASLPTYYLTKEYSSEWVIKVYPKDGKYAFLLGKRVTDDEPSPARFYSRNTVKSAVTAKRNALSTLFKHINGLS